MDNYNFLMCEIEIRINKLKSFLEGKNLDKELKKSVEIRLHEYQNLYDFAKLHETID